MPRHTPVLLHEVIEGIAVSNGATVVDATLGGGGYTKALLERYKDLVIVGIDQDKRAVREMKRWIAEAEGNFSGTIYFAEANFREMDKALTGLGIREVDAVMFDLGLSSDQLERSGRGFSFLRDEPLLMTCAEDPARSVFTAQDVVNRWSENAIADVLFAYGDERYARRIARAIIEARKKRPITTTYQLVEIIAGAVPAPYRKGKIHFATRTFQGLRIAVNDELEALREGLEKAFEALREGGRIATVSFHSLEDRIVKQTLQIWVKDGRGVSLTKKPIVPRGAEKQANSRSRSAKLRIFQKAKS